jgi:hypothetical protein
MSLDGPEARKKLFIMLSIKVLHLLIPATLSLPQDIGAETSPTTVTQAEATSDIFISVPEAEVTPESTISSDGQCDLFNDIICPENFVCIQPLGTQQLGFWCILDGLVLGQSCDTNCAAGPGCINKRGLQCRGDLKCVVTFQGKICTAGDAY